MEKGYFPLLKIQHYNGNHHILAKNQFLHKVKYIDNASCSFCADQEETIHHLLWERKHTKALIKELRKWLSDNNIFINVSEISFIFGLYNKGTSIAEQQILLETKYYIYFCKSSKASLNRKALKRKLILLYDTIKKAAIFENSLENSIQTWAHYHELLT